MLLEPGPLPALDTSWYSVRFDPPNFSDMVTAAISELDSATGQMDSLVDPAAIFSDTLDGDTIMTDLESVDQINGDNAHLANLSGIAVGDTYKANGDAALTAAVQTIPGEAWTHVPDTTAYGTVTQAAPTARIAGVALANLSGGDPQTYTAGDQFQLVVRMDTTTGQEFDYYNVYVYATMKHDNDPQPDLPIGHTGADGAVTWRGTWQQTDAGAWSMIVHADPVTGGDIVSQQYTWTVYAVGRQPAGVSTPLVTVQLLDQTSQDMANIHVGDFWFLTVTGPPLEPVYITATLNGAAQPEANIGTTDANGNLQLSGQWGGGDAGAWLEYYAVGRYPYPFPLNFTVEP